MARCATRTIIFQRENVNHLILFHSLYLVFPPNILLGMCPGLSEPLPHYSLFIIDPILVTFGPKCNFRDPNLVAFYFNELTHFLNWMKNTLLFTYSTKLLVLLLTVNMKNCLTSKTPKMCNPILVTLLKMRPHYSQSSRENATPSSGTSPLTSYKEVHPWVFFTLPIIMFPK